MKTSNDPSSCLAHPRVIFRLLLAAVTIAMALGSNRGDAGTLATVEPTSEQALALALEAQTLRDRGAMLDWLRKAARAGHLPSQELLGVVLLNGPVVMGTGAEQAPCEAWTWFIRAAEQGSEIARLHRDLLNRQAFARRCG